MRDKKPHLQLVNGLVSLDLLTTAHFFASNQMNRQNSKDTPVKKEKEKKETEYLSTVDYGFETKHR